MHLFQFHKGSIRTRDAWGKPLAINRFQFHKGSIRTLTAVAYGYLDEVRFNSIKVQLELVPPVRQSLA